jgi:hypothetical protein
MSANDLIVIDTLGKLQAHGHEMSRGSLGRECRECRELGRWHGTAR